MQEFLIALLDAAALEAIGRAQIALDCDARVGWTENHPCQKIIDVCDEYLTASGLWYNLDVLDIHDWLCHPEDPEECDGGCTCFPNPARLRVYEVTT